MVYATYQHYKDEYCGTAIPSEKEFQNVIRKASQHIDNFTFGRITEENAGEYASLPDCACDMAETIYNLTGSTGKMKEKKSESIDGYSVTYVTEGTDGNPAEKTLQKKLYSIARVYLLNTGLLSLEC